MSTILGSAALLALAAFLYYVSPHVFRRWEERRLAARCRETRTLVLSYDDGPSPRLTPRILDLLAKAGAHATFFAMGRAVPGNESVLDRLVSEGHELGCHSQEHLNAWKCPPSQGIRDIRAGYAALSRWLPSDGPFRPPYGKLTLPCWWEATRRGSSFGWWTIGAGDTTDSRRDPAEVVTELREAGGGVVLLHDLDREPERDDWVLAATAHLLEAARDEGYQVMTLGQLYAEMRR